MKNYNKTFSVSTEGMENGYVKFTFRPLLDRGGRPVLSINEVRYSVSEGNNKEWILLPVSVNLIYIVNGFETNIPTYFQHRITTPEGGKTEWGGTLVEILRQVVKREKGEFDNLII